MVIDDALRVAGGARGVVERDRLPLVGRVQRREVRIAVGEEGLVVELAQALAARAFGIVDVDHQRLAGPVCASASFINGASSVSVSSALASPCSRMKASVAASRRMLSALRTAPHIGTP